MATVTLTTTPTQIDDGTAASLAVVNTSSVEVVVSRAGTNQPITERLRPGRNTTVYPEGNAVTAATVSGAGSVTVTTTAKPAGPITRDELSGTYAAHGRRSVAVYDEFSRYADGALSGKTPLVGSAWTTSGAVPTTIVSGKATSSGTGYAGQFLTSTVKGITAEFAWSGSGTGQAMTLIASTDSSITVANAVHFNFGPAGFTLTCRKDAGAFDVLVFGTWRQAMKVDGSTTYRVSMGIRGNSVIVNGPNGEVYSATDPRVGLLAGTLAIWEPTTASSTQCLLVSAGATSDASTGSPMPYALGDDAAGAGYLMGPNGQAVGNRNTRSEASVGQDPTSGLPSLILGPLGSALGVLQAGIAVGATSISTDIFIPTGSTIQLESGTNSETVTASGNSTGTGPYATAIGATANAHAAGTAAIVTVPAAHIAKFTNNAGTVTAPASVIFTNIYASGQTSRLTQASSGVWDTSGSVGTGKGVLKVGSFTTANRPAAATVGQGCQGYDTTLGIPIWSNGTVWKDAAGNTV